MKRVANQEYPFDQGFWRADGLMPGVAASAVGYSAHSMSVAFRRGMPSPHVTFLITLDQPVVTGWSLEQASGPDATCVEVVTAGLHTSPAYICQPPAQTGIELALHLPAARTILGLPASKLCYGAYDASDVIGPAISLLRGRLIETRAWPERFAIVRQFLQAQSDRTDTRPRLRPEISEAWTWLTRRRGTGRISSLADHVLLSQRQLHDLFIAEFGVAPKRFNRLLRFQRVKRIIANRVDCRARIDLAGIAACCGYADQSHLTRDFTSLAGISPTGWLAEEYGGIMAGSYGFDGSAEMSYRELPAIGMVEP